MAVRLLLTGFEAFGEHAMNPSERVVRRLADAGPGGVVLSTRVLPVSYTDAFASVREALDNERLHGVLMLGLGAGRQRIDFERFAVNWRGTTHQDNDGRRVDGEPIDPGGPAAYFSTVPLEEMVAACHAVGIPAGVSSHAGTFICNQILYQALRHCDQFSLRCRVGFAHLPLLEHQAGPDQPSMSEDALLWGVQAALDCLASLPQADEIPVDPLGE